jgi:NAD+ kinase
MVTVIFFFFVFPHSLAGLVIDGSIAYPFNDGTKVLLEVHPEDALLTITM